MPAEVTRESLQYQITVLNGQHERGELSDSKYSQLVAKVIEKMDNAPSFLELDQDAAESLADRLEVFREMLPGKVSELITELGLENLLRNPQEDLTFETNYIIMGIFKVNTLEKALKK